MPVEIRSSFIEFEDSSVVSLMPIARSSELVTRLARIHAIPFSEPSPEEVRAAVEAVERGDEWEDYESLVRMAERNEKNGHSDRARGFRTDAATTRERWFADGLVDRGRLESPGVIQAVATRPTWTQRYDPIRLTVQHDAFVHEHIDDAMARHAAVDVMHPDVTLTDVVNDPAALERYRSDTGNLLGHLGVERLVLIRGLPICEFSFGFTRVSSTPVYKREHQGISIDMPVRLKAFDPLPVIGAKRPIYVTQQQNEALYFKLDEARVRRWLKANQVVDVPDGGLGRAYIERYDDFGPFIEMFRDREGGGSYPRTVPAYTYLLLHTISHQMMHSLADTSGVDRDGIGEHIFPADLSFVIFRKGMTPDLGNVSAMWRNHADAFLRRALDPRTLRCGSGSLCDVRGGACPACIMVSEVSCIASNLILSRAVLRGGQVPEWEPKTAPNLVGYFEPSLG